MNIVVLDGYILNPGDLSWDALAKLGNLKVYDRTPQDLKSERIKNADIVLGNKAGLNAMDIENAKNLKYIGVMATGYNNVDLDAARTRGIVVTNVPAYSTASVAQFTFSLILALTSKVAEYSESVHRGDWVKSKDFSYIVAPVSELQNKTLGIIGFGSIGKEVAKIAIAFGMKVITPKRHDDQKDTETIRFVSQEDCFKNADILSLHCPLNEKTKHLINKKTLSLMKPSALLINTSRGPVVNDQDLAEALNQNKIAGAGLDVLSNEPPKADDPLLSAKNCIITPHIAFQTLEARTRLMEVLVENVKAFLDGKPQNVVS